LTGLTGLCFSLGACLLIDNVNQRFGNRGSRGIGDLALDLRVLSMSQGSESEED
jgi:hypothetical protein